MFYWPIYSLSITLSGQQSDKRQHLYIISFNKKLTHRRTQKYCIPDNSRTKKPNQKTMTTIKTAENIINSVLCVVSHFYEMMVLGDGKIDVRNEVRRKFQR